ncbi:pleckstrin homology domain-containing family A member 7 [Chanos chanos]|uniref:Pleckstrin homology domain-containing family A member 7 n=1 Tax=Chanos chanos TaxID=29144 RepID=A0A6J2V9U3_CHACN|nr:pleckstrin homology domain-containing family A member 7-like [Chanos chanos]
MADPLEQDRLPEHWSFGVCQDGRVFFIDDETRTTTWLHPRTFEPVNSGHMIRSDLPRGWEEGFTNEGANYFIDHNQRTTTFRHPVTGQISSDNFDFILQEEPSVHMSKAQTDPRPSSTVSEASTVVTSSTVDTAPGFKGSRNSRKVHSFGKRDQAIKRNPNVPVVVRGWLYKQDSTGMRLWKRKWFVLADYCLFYYKDSREESVLGSIPLPSYIISPVEPEDHISRKYAFKACHTGMRSYIYKQSSLIASQAEHSGMRTYFFSADTQEDMNNWIQAMNQAALMQNHEVKSTSEDLERSETSNSLDKPERQAVPQTNHVDGFAASELEELHPDPAFLEKHEVLVPEEEIQIQEDSLSHREVQEIRGKSPALKTEEVEVALQPGSAPNSRNHSQAPSRAGSTLPPMLRNGSVSEHDKVLENSRGPTPQYDSQIQTQRKNTLEQVEHWVTVQRAEQRNTLQRRTPPLHSKLSAVDPYQSQPKTLRQSLPVSWNQLPSDYKYAQDRISHYQMTHGPLAKDATVWRLYEWQQRQRYRHGSPTAPIYTPAPNYATAISASRTKPLQPRSISVPPTPEDIPPPGPPGGRVLSPLRRPHTPADRVTVRPQEERSTTEVSFSGSPQRTLSRKSATIERRSMPPSGYMTHTVSAPSLHGKTVDDTYVQLKKNLEYLDLKVAGNETLIGRTAKPVKVAESDVDVTLSRLCEQDKVLQELGNRIRSLKEDKDKLESVLDVSHQQLEQYQDQPAHAEKITYQQKLLREDLVHIRADISRASSEMERAWEEYSRLEQAVEQLRQALQVQMDQCPVPQEKNQLKRELWRIEDVIAGLSSNKANYKVTVDSMQNPERKLVPSLSSVPSRSATPVGGDIHPAQRSLNSSPVPPSNDYSTTSSHQPLLHPYPVPSWAEDAAPPRPPLPLHYMIEDQPPAVPPLPKEATVIRHTSVRGLKRQSDERKRDRESNYINGDFRAEMRSYRSEPELPGSARGSEIGYQTLPNRDLSSSSARLRQSYTTLRRADSGFDMRERPKSALERLCPPELQLPQTSHRGRMSAEEQLERMKRHQRALVRERKRNLSQGERSTRSSSSSSRPVLTDLGPSSLEQDIDLQMTGRMVQGEERQGAEGRDQEEQAPPCETQRSTSDDWLTVVAKPMKVQDLEPIDFDLDLSRELSIPKKVAIPKRYIDLEPEEPLSKEEMETRSRNVEKIKSLLAKSSGQAVPLPRDPEQLDFSDLDGALKHNERIMSMPSALAPEASRKSKEVAESQSWAGW